jgi:hypothetical protein
MAQCNAWRGPEIDLANNGRRKFSQSPLSYLPRPDPDEAARFGMAAGAAALLGSGAQLYRRGRKPTARAGAAEIASLKADGVGPVEIARRLGIGRASVYRVLAA